jgi:hypothetical protein
MALTAGMPLRDALTFVVSEIYKRDGVLTEERVRWMLDRSHRYFLPRAREFLQALLPRGV